MRVTEQAVERVARALCREAGVDEEAWRGYGDSAAIAAIEAIPEPAASLMGVERTPAAKWRAEGKPDPHDDRYDCERAQLAGGRYTDDEVANAVFLDPNIGNLTIAKDRIRWLSRKVEALIAEERGPK